MIKIPAKTAIKFLLAEDVRSEGNGKFSLLGVFPGERFMVGGEPPVGTPEKLAFAMLSLSFVFVITDGEGKIPSKFKIIDTDGKKTLIEIPIESGIEIVKGRPAIFVTGAKPFAGGSFGTYAAQLELGNKKFKFPFSIEKAPPARDSLSLRGAALGKSASSGSA
jgi:hypothetical protein